MATISFNSAMNYLDKIDVEQSLIESSINSPNFHYKNTRVRWFTSALIHTGRVRTHFKS
jgi:hypothetical protein